MGELRAEFTQEAAKERRISVEWPGPGLRNLPGVESAVLKVADLPWESPCLLAMAFHGNWNLLCQIKLLGEKNQLPLPLAASLLRVLPPTLIFVAA